MRIWTWAVEDSNAGEEASQPLSTPLSLGLAIQLRSVAAHAVRVVLLCPLFGSEMATPAIGFVTKKPHHPLATMRRSLSPACIKLSL